MVASEESSEQYSQLRKLSLIESSIGYLPAEIEVPGIELGAEKWDEMIRLTQSDLRERAIVVSTSRGKIIISKIFKGVAEAESTVASIDTPLLPHGFRSLLPGLRDITLVHSHPKPIELDQLKTTLISDADIRSFHSSDFKAMVMIDPGGVHLLLHALYADLDRPLPSFNLHKTALDKALAGRKTMAEAMVELANLLYPCGIRYYYAPDLSPTAEGKITLKVVNRVSNLSMLS